MRVVVTGGAGFIGSAVVRALLDRDREQVAVLDKMTYAASPLTLAAYRDRSDLTCYRQDICDLDAVRMVLDAFEPDAIVHLAAESHVDRSIDGPEDFVRTNVVGTQVLLDAALGYWRAMPAARRDGFRLVHVSTDEVFGSLGETDIFNESTHYAPRSPYSASKAASDHLVRAWHHTFGLPTIVTNCSNNYGPYQFPEKLIPLMILRGLAGQPMPVYGQGLNVRDWLFVDDHAAALILVLRNAQPGGTYLIGGRSERRNVDVVNAIASLLDDLCPVGAPHARLIKFVDDRPGHDHRYAIDASFIERELGWRPQTTFEQGLRQTVRWYIDSREWWTSILDGTYRLERLGIAS